MTCIHYRNSYLIYKCVKKDLKFIKTKSPIGKHHQVLVHALPALCLYVCEITTSCSNSPVLPLAQASALHYRRGYSPACSVSPLGY